MVKEDQYFPADLILIKSSNASGLAYIETKNLDGETNLKHKSCLKELQATITSPEKATALRGLITCESPNDQLYKFEGTLNLGSDNPVSSDAFSLDHNSLLLRGTSLRNTEWVYGLVVYSGHDTRIMKNQSKTRTKFSKLELQTNRQIIYIFIFQIFICLIGATFNQLWTLRIGNTQHQYLALFNTEMTETNNFTEAIIKESLTRFGTWMLLFANFVPISLIVTMELVKFFQAQFIQWDT